jgi:hypothetical protein
MDLPQSDERQVLGSEDPQKLAAVLRNSFGGVPVSDTQVQNASAVQIACASGACTEGMHEPGNRRQSVRCEEFGSRKLALLPAAIDCATAYRRTGGAGSRL